MNCEWVDYIFVQSTAWFLNHDILIVTTTCTENRPFITISGNLVDENFPCPGTALILGSKSNVHYQSLLPLNRQLKKKQFKVSLPQNTIKLKMFMATRAAQSYHLKLDLNSREEFPNLMPSRGKIPFLPVASSSSRGMVKSSRQTNQLNQKLNKEQYGSTYSTTESKINEQEGNEPNKKAGTNENKDCLVCKIFNYNMDGEIFNFEFTSNKKGKNSEMWTRLQKYSSPSSKL